MIQIQQNGLSPRGGSKGHRRTRSATNKEELCGGGVGAKASVTPTPSAQHGRFFNDPAPCSASILPTMGSTPSSSPPSPSCKGHPKQRAMRQSTTVRLAAMAATALAALLCTRATFASPSLRNTSLRATAAESKSRQDRCAGRIEKRRGLGVPGDRQQCAAVLPAAVVESESSSWFVSVHVDRAPAAAEPMKRLRGTAPVER